jgi:predicted dehydrogenase
MRTALVGLGEIGQHHLRAIRAGDSSSLVAVCDLDPDLVAAAAVGGTAGYTSLERMLAEERIEAVDVCLPHSLHLETALAAIDAGCHVLLEKPMAVDVAACDRITAAAEAAGVAVAISHNQLFYEPHQRLASLIERGCLGSLRSLYARLWIGDRYRGWREQPEIVGGGLLMDAGVHRVYMLRALGGPVVAVSATMDEPRAEQAFSVDFEFANGALGEIQGSYYAPSGVFDDRLDVAGTRGMAQVAGCEAYSEGDLGHEPQLRARLDGSWTEDPVSDTWEASVSRSVEQALGALANGERPRVDAAAGRETVALIDAAYRSAELGERVSTAGPRSAVGSER